MTSEQSQRRRQSAQAAALAWHIRNVGSTPTHALIVAAFKAGAAWQRKRK